MRVEQVDWLYRVSDNLENYLTRLTDKLNPYHYYPATQGLTKDGELIQLGYSCLALKTYYITGLWDQLPDTNQKSWIEFIQSFQVKGEHEESAFVDTALTQGIQRRTFKQNVKLAGKNVFTQLGILPKPLNQTSPVQLAINAETKQAIATLREVGSHNVYPYSGFPTNSEKVVAYLDKQNWQKPWAAGAQFASLAVYINTQGAQLVSTDELKKLSQSSSDYIEGLADSNTGGYFKGNIPANGELINGAMKILTGLDWLGIPIHYPEKLIDTCLAIQPQSEGCHLVDTVYVLHRTLQQTSYRRNDIQSYYEKILDMIKAHYVQDEGGFSYNIGASQTNYYGARITHGLPVADLHGTILLVWALAMILDIELNKLNWNIIKP